MKILLFLPVLLLTGLLCAQTGFTLLPSLPFPQTEFTDLLVDNDTIIGYGVGFNDSIEWRQGIVIAKLDSSGNLLNSIIVLDSLGDLLSVAKHWGKIIKTSDGGYAATAATFFRNSAILIKLTYDLQIEFIKEYPDTVNLSNFSYIPFETEDGYFLYGAIQRPDFFEDGFIRHVDKLGNTIWFKYVLYSNFSNAVLDIKKLTDTLFVAGIGTATNGNVGVVSLSFFNQEGDEVDYWASDIDPDMGYIRKIVAADSGGLILYGLYVTEVIGMTTLVQPTLSKLDINLQSEWIQHFGPIKSLISENTLRDFSLAIDGNYIGGGEITIQNMPGQPARRHGWLYKFTPQGDSIWSRNIPTPFPNYYSNGGFLAGVGILSSGSIVGGGSAYSSSTGESYGWIVKVTNDGCLDTVFCQTSGTFTLPGKAEIDGMTIYPNPAGEQVSIKYPAGLNYGRLRLYHANSRVVSERTLDQAGQVIIVDIRHLAPGVYIVEIMDESHVLKRARLIVSR